MEQNLEKKIDFKSKLINFYKFNKVKISIFICVVVIIIISITASVYHKEKKNILISEKYVQAGIYLASDKKKKAKILLEEIVSSKNEFYSLLAFNILLEKNLISDEEKILEYFDILENIISSKENADLLSLKKSLYFMKISDFKKGKNLLKNLIDKNSNLKSIAQELIE
tara:strand:+ start:346 stop:852 length:507 start_codon:yes stop_codon:yes gene_type:complete